MICLGFYAVSTVFQLFNGDSSQIHVSWTFFLNQRLTSPWSWHWLASRSVIPIIQRAKGGGESITTGFKDIDLSQPWIEPMTSRSRGGRSDH